MNLFCNILLNFFLSVSQTPHRVPTEIQHCISLCVLEHLCHFTLLEESSHSNLISHNFFYKNKSDLF